MLEITHTPGPWRFSEIRRPPVGNFSDHDVGPDGNVFWGYSISGSNKDGGHILPTLGAVHNFPDNMLANARLIAAAPDLLEALKAIAAWAEQANPAGYGGLREHLYRKIENAIAKAEGR